MKKIIAFTAIRSEYDLLSALYKKLHDDISINLQLIVSGAHLSNAYGYSVQEIERDGLNILVKIETLLNSDSKAARLKSASILMQNSIDIITQFEPDLIIFAGDREEVMVASMIAGYLEIPSIHFFGGDHVKDSHIDNPIRHATSKLSSAHFVACDAHAKRLQLMGEAPERVFNIGSVALDKFRSEPFWDKQQILDKHNDGNDFGDYAIVIFHPLPLERERVSEIFRNILNGLKQAGLNAFVSYPNIDPGNKEIISVIEEFSADSSFIFFKNLPREEFLGVYKSSKLIIGNSSSGTLESASIPVAAVNVGLRQVGRATNENVIFCDITADAIGNAIKLALSDSFQKMVAEVRNIYGEGNSADMALKLIKQTDFKKLVFKNEDILEMHDE